MQTRSNHRLAIALALFVFTSLAAASLGAAMVWGASPRGVLLTLGALAGSAGIVWAATRIRDTVREWRWNAGHRVR
jgi:hypothetical protein